MIFKSRQVNLDPEPYLYEPTEVQPGYPEDARQRFSIEEHAVDQLGHWAPRPGFEPTRDPFPWVDEFGGAYTDEQVRSGYAPNDVEWAPRREQFDTPVNPILTHYRENTGPGFDLTYYLTQLEAASADPVIARIAFSPYVEYTPEQIDHARRVLTRLANWSAS